MERQRLDRNNNELRPRVRRQLKSARQDLDALHKAQTDYYRGADDPTDDGSFNRRKRQPKVMKTYVLAKLEEAFAALEAQLSDHLEREERTLYANVGDGSQPETAGLEAQVAAHQQDHIELVAKGDAVRREVVYVPPLKGTMNALLQHMEKQIQYEETRLFPELLGIAAPDHETPVPQRFRTSDDVARSLRVAHPPTPQLDEEPEGGFFSRLFSGWRKDR